MSFHIYKNKNSKYEAAFVVNGKLVWDTSPQQYEKKQGCYKAIRSLMKYMGVRESEFQDDTTSVSYRWKIYLVGNSSFVDKKPHKKYIPQNSKR